jgi:hypothetical protein
MSTVTTPTGRRSTRVGGSFSQSKRETLCSFISKPKSPLREQHEFHPITTENQKKFSPFLTPQKTTPTTPTIPTVTPTTPTITLTRTPTITPITPTTPSTRLSSSLSLNWEPKEKMERFFVVGDPGQPGPDRVAVAKAMNFLQQEWASKGEPVALFVLSTGDNHYPNDTSKAFETLEEEMLDIVPLPWAFVLGNHDVSPELYRWHTRHHNQRNGRWICPGPAYRLSDHLVLDIFNQIEIYVINTNKFKKIVRSNAIGPAPLFYQSVDSNWWSEQKKNLSHLLSSTSQHKWRIVAGHHPCEYVPWNFAEHRLPVVRYMAATFMRGSAIHRVRRQSLAHVIRRGADLYLSGHQHLMAIMRLSALGRSHVETRCTFVVVGASSILDQEKEEFSDDELELTEMNVGCEFATLYESPSSFGLESDDDDLFQMKQSICPLYSSSPLSEVSDAPVEIEMQSLPLQKTEDNASPIPGRQTSRSPTPTNFMSRSVRTPSPNPIPPCFTDLNTSVGFTTSVGSLPTNNPHRHHQSSSIRRVQTKPNPRYEYEWLAPPAFGFVVVDVTISQLTVRCYVVKSGCPVEIQRHTIFRPIEIPKEHFFKH